MATTAAMERILKENLLEAIRKVKEISPKRNFVESIELILPVRDIDLRRPENRFRIFVKLPHPIAYRDKIAFFADEVHASEAREIASKSEDIITVIDRVGIETLRTSKREIRKIAKRHRILLATTTLMSLVARYFGRYLSPRNKLPMPVPPSRRAADAIAEAKRTVAVRLHKNLAIQAKIGHRLMSDEELTENGVALILAVVPRLPDKWRNLRRYAFVKTTMGPPVKFSLFVKRK